MDILSFVSIGILIGFLVGLFLKLPGVSMTNDVTVGIAGALLGGFLFGGLGTTENVLWDTVGASVIGALLFLVVSHAVVAFRRRHQQVS